MLQKNFWDLERRIYKDKRSVGVAIDMRRSKMHENIWALLKDDCTLCECY